ncbi:MAG: type II toxin-antitoxin system PemK/MazF family toxin [Gemmataceae bacterium]|nr:type II toxin-antitoxin system PemK/MazF family toxin [Gemmataceae bacterium]MCI0740414.1 type II toxin-antitoxin system PemK/MazF family toxin [Gemmataceae bacterium]
MTRRGDVVLVQFPYVGGGHGKTRPGVVVQCDRLNRQIQNKNATSPPSSQGSRGSPWARFRRPTGPEHRHERQALRAKARTRLRGRKMNRTGLQASAGLVPEASKFSPRDPQRLRRGRLPPLTIAQILAWADSYYARTKKWPEADSGYVYENRNEMWRRIDSALRLGLRGLERGSSLAKLLSQARGKRNLKALSPLTEGQIAAWAQQHRRRTGRWPNENSGPIADTRGEVWCNVDAALRMGFRGLPGGDSVPRLLNRAFDVANPVSLPRLQVQQILGWADEHHQRTGQWPTAKAGPIRGAPQRSWSAVDSALQRSRVAGLPGRWSLAHLLFKFRNVRNKACLPRLTLRKILAWADAHYKRTGCWPTHASGPIAQAPGETWGAIHGALKTGRRGLPGGSSLVALLAKRRGVRNRVHPPRLTVRRILGWSDAHFQHTGHWPRYESGPVAQAPGEKWSAINAALRYGLRGLRCGSSLAKILAKRRGVPIRPDISPLSYLRILAWADAHFQKIGRWPAVKSGPIAQAPGETWAAIDAALRVGARGLRGGSSLGRLLAKERGVRNRVRPRRSRRR